MASPEAHPFGKLREVLTLHPVARRLPVMFQAERMAQEVSALPDWWWRKHLGPFHDGGWESISLWAPDGNLFRQHSAGGTFAATPALRACSYVEDALSSFPGRRHRVRLMRLRPGSRILRHSDPMHAISRDLVRIHVPIETSPEVSFLIGGKELPLQPGEAWHIDVRFPHEVANRSSRNRVHLVADFIADDGLRHLLDASAVHGRARLTGYFVKHSFPEPLRRWLGIGN